jgi:hypothetical protein
MRRQPFRNCWAVNTARCQRSRTICPELQLPQQEQAASLLQPPGPITAEELGHVELVSNGVAMLNNGARQ